MQHLPGKRNMLERRGGRKEGWLDKKAYPDGKGTGAHRNAQIGIGLKGLKGLNGMRAEARKGV